MNEPKLTVKEINSQRAALDEAIGLAVKFDHALQALTKAGIDKSVESGGVHIMEHAMRAENDYLADLKTKKKATLDPWMKTLVVRDQAIPAQIDRLQKERANAVNDPWSDAGEFDQKIELLKSELESWKQFNLTGDTEDLPENSEQIMKIADPVGYEAHFGKSAQRAA